MAVGHRRWAEGGIGEDMAVDIEANIDTAGIAMSVDENIVRDDIGDDVGLVEEKVEESDRVIEALVAVHGSDYGVTGEDGGPGVGEHRLAGRGGGEIEVAGADKRLDAVVEVEAWSD